MKIVLKHSLTLANLAVCALLTTGMAHAQTNLALWNFNDGVTNATGGANEFAVDSVAPGVTASMTSNFVAANITNFNGTTIGAQNGDAAGKALALQNGTNGVNNGRNLTFSVGTTGYQSLGVAFAIQRTATGFNNDQFQYSTDGANFINFSAPFVPVADFTQAVSLVTFDLSSVTGLNNNAGAAFRIVFDGGTTTSSSGNNRMDNLRVFGTALTGGVTPPVPAVPEPGGLALLAGVGLAGMAYRRRIRR